MEKLDLTNENEIKNFEFLLNNFFKSKYALSFDEISLQNAHKQLISRSDFDKIFYLYFDLVLNFYLTWSDIYEWGKFQGVYFSKGKIEGGSILDDSIRFEGKMLMHRVLISFIFRYRACWDKLMGFLIMFYVPKEYENFCNSKSKISAYKKLSEKNTDLKIINEQLLGKINKFNDDFRTPEAHNSGRVRKWTLTMERLGDTPLIDIFWYWNTLNVFFHKIQSEVLEKG